MARGRLLHETGATLLDRHTRRDLAAAQRRAERGVDRVWHGLGAATRTRDCTTATGAATPASRASRHSARSHTAGGHRPLKPRGCTRRPWTDAQSAGSQRLYRHSSRAQRSARTGDSGSHCDLDTWNVLGRSSDGRPGAPSAHSRHQQCRRGDQVVQAAIRAAVAEELRMSAVFGYALWFAQACIAIAMLNGIVRLFIGPAAQDRILAFDSIYMNGMLMLLLLGIS